MKSRLLWRLFFAFVAVIALSFTAFYFYLIPQLRSFLINYTEDSLREKAALAQPKSWDPALLDAQADQLSKQLNVRVTFIDQTGRVLGDSSVALSQLPQIENHLQRPEVQEALQGSIGTRIRYSSTVQLDMMYVAMAIDQGFVRVAVPLHVIVKTVDAVKRSVIIGIVVALALASLLAFFLSQRASRLVQMVVDAASRISLGDFSHRVPSDVPAELGVLANALNEMAESLGKQHDSLVNERNQLKTVLDSMVEGVLVCGPKGDVLLMNPALQRMFGFNETPAGQSLMECFRNKKLDDSVRVVFSTGRATSDEVAFYLERAEKLFNIQSAPLHIDAEVVGAVSVFYDLTEMKRLENVRKEFVANVSHELKTPLTSIRGFAETLQNSQAQGAIEPATSERFLAKIQSNATQLQQLIEDLLNLAELESGRMPMELTPVDLNELVTSLHHAYEEACQQKQLELMVSIPRGTTVSSEPAALRQILSNLIDNAIKYSDVGGAIEITAKTSGAVCEVSVRDTGIGIPEPDQAHIFERFYRVDKARSRELGGTGLGLSIVKHLVQTQGGEVGLESTAGQGSRFYFKLPV